MCAATDALPSPHLALPPAMVWPAQAIRGAVGPESDMARRFVIACLASRRHPEELATVRALAPDAQAGWQAVATLAREEWVSPLLYRIVRDHDLVPHDIEHAWR
ncbi:MAG TPA: hypothetical protein VGA61_03620, partial [Anaerolineae bacterium]